MQRWLFLWLTVWAVALQVHANDKIIVGYWSSWESKMLPIEHIPWTQITHINFAFAIVNEGPLPVLTQPQKTQLSKLTTVAHQNNVKVLLSIGGWTGGKMMSSMASTPDNRSKFIRQVTDWTLQFGLDGIDIDWEYPGQGGLECNLLDYANDANNYLLLLKELREALDQAFVSLQSTDPSGAHKLLTAAVASLPFSRNGAPMADVSAFASVLDWVFIMAYDLYAGRPTLAGPNAPLLSSTRAGAQPLSATQAIDAWTAAHFPAEQIVLGLPFYGYASQPKNNILDDTTSIVAIYPTRPQGDAEDELAAPPCPGVKRSFSGVWKWRSLRATGILLDGRVPGGQWIKSWDAESQTPWLYHPTSRLLITYDDPDSIAIKTNLAACRNLKGVGMWNLAQDDYRPNGMGQLLHSIQSQLGQTCDTNLILPPSRLVGPHFDAMPLHEVGGRRFGNITTTTGDSVGIPVQRLEPTGINHAAQPQPSRAANRISSHGNSQCRSHVIRLGWTMAVTTLAIVVILLS